EIGKVTEEEYLTANGASRSNIGDAGLHRFSASMSPKTWSRLVKTQADQDMALEARRATLRAEYWRKVESGEITPPSRTQRLLRAAQGHPDNESTQAARRLLAKMGYAAPAE